SLQFLNIINVLVVTHTTYLIAINSVKVKDNLLEFKFATKIAFGIIMLYFFCAEARASKVFEQQTKKKNAKQWMKYELHYITLHVTLNIYRDYDKPSFHIWIHPKSNSVVEIVKGIS
uniref:Uncharacterized protein n=1 Tax=Glossina palpalis gambiensis TaxID=67801 RepID=A0A1B0AZ88_9MUSC